MKKCPLCAEDIQDAAIKCRHCGSDLVSPTKKKAFGNRPLTRRQMWSWLISFAIVGTCMYKFASINASDKDEQARLEPQRRKDSADLMKYLDARLAQRSWATKSYSAEYSRSSNGESISVSTYYALQEPAGVVAGESKTIVRYVLDYLLKLGRRPMADHIGVFVHAAGRGTGATGEAIVGLFGMASYNWTTDSIEWKPEND